MTPSMVTPMSSGFAGYLKCDDFTTIKNGTVMWPTSVYDKYIEVITNKITAKIYCDTSAVTQPTGFSYNSWAADCSTTTSWEWGYKKYIFGSDGCVVYPPPKTAGQLLRDIIEQRQTPAIHVCRQGLRASIDIREQRARETLRRVIGDDKYQSFLRNGFVSVRGRSGLIYQIFPGHNMTCVFDRGKMVERLCVVLAKDFPPTDSLIMRYLLILNNENKFRGLANKHAVYKPNLTVQSQDQRSLVEIFKSLKKVA